MHGKAKTRISAVLKQSARSVLRKHYQLCFKEALPALLSKKCSMREREGHAEVPTSIVCAAPAGERARPPWRRNP